MEIVRCSEDEAYGTTNMKTTAGYGGLGISTLELSLKYITIEKLTECRSWE